MQGFTFDRLERYLAAAEVVLALRKTGGFPERSKVLDLGGGGTALDGGPAAKLDALVGGLDIVTADLPARCGPGATVIEPGRRLPFDDGAFPIVISLDFLGRLPSECREDFVREALRVTERALIIGAPFRTLEREAASRFLEAFSRAAVGAAPSDLGERLAVGLPSARLVAERLRAEGLPCFRFENGNPVHWYLGLAVGRLLARTLEPEAAARAEALLHDFARPICLPCNSYRTIYVVSKQGALFLEPVRRRIAGLLAPLQDTQDLPRGRGFEAACARALREIDSRIETSHQAPMARTVLAEPFVAPAPPAIQSPTMPKPEPKALPKPKDLPRPLDEIPESQKPAHSADVDLRSMHVETAFQHLFRSESVPKTRVAHGEAPPAPESVRPEPEVGESVPDESKPASKVKVSTPIPQEPPVADAPKVEPLVAKEPPPPAPSPIHPSQDASPEAPADATPTVAPRSAPEPTHAVELPPPEPPALSILLYAPDAESDDLLETLESIRRQTLPRWELQIVGAACQESRVASCLDAIRDDAPGRLRVHQPGTPGLEADAGNGAARLARAERLCILRAGDRLEPNALAETLRALEADPQADFFYCDATVASRDGHGVEPFFKPSFSPELLLSGEYMGPLFAVRKSLFLRVGGFSSDPDVCERFDLALRLAEGARRIERIAEILCRSRVTQAQWRRSERQALRQAIKRRGLQADVAKAIVEGKYRVRFRVSHSSKVSVIIAARDGARALKQCLRAIERNTLHGNHEILVVNCSERDAAMSRFLSVEVRHNRALRYINHDTAGNRAAILNLAACGCTSPFLLFLNADALVASEGWMEALLEFAQQKEIGAVGGKIVSAGRRIYHAGMVLGLGSIAGNAFEGLAEGDGRYAGHANLVRNYSAVSADCLMTRREVFREVGGFRESLGVAWSDVDYCLELRKRGYRIVYTPYARLTIPKPQARSSAATREDARAIEQEIARMRTKWGDALRHDPYYHPNLTLEPPGFMPREASEK